MTSAAPLLCHQVTKAFGGRTVVDKVDLCLNPGELTALIGPSGAGKTTLLRLLAGMEKPDFGTISSGDSILSSSTTLTPPEKRRIGLIFQDFALFPHMNVVDNICFGLHQLPKLEQETTAKDWVTRLGLTDRAEAFPHQLSGGEQQRVAIARALAPAPVAILMDEPFSGLDPALREQARQVALGAIRETETPALLVTHDANEAMAFADQISIINQGRIIQAGPPRDLFERPESLDAAHALGKVLTVQKSTLPEAFQQICPDADTLHMRREAIQVDLSSYVKMTVRTAKCVGPFMVLELDHNGETFVSRSLASNLPKPGDMIGVSLNIGKVFAFDQNQT